MAPHSSRFVFRHLKYGLATAALLAMAAAPLTAIEEEVCL